MITFEQAVEGYLIDARARQLSPKTIADYRNSFRHFADWLVVEGRDANEPLAGIGREDVRRFMAWLGEVSIAPDSIAPKPPQRLSKKTIANIHTGMSALWTWAVQEGIVEAHVVRAVQPPRPAQPVIEPFTREEVEALLDACRYTEMYDRPGKAPCRNARPTATRDRAIILTLLDTGARSGELFKSRAWPERYARIGDLDRGNLTISVWGKGDKQRLLRISPATLKALWRYLTRRPRYTEDEALFAGLRGGPLSQSGVAQLMQRLGERAGVEDVHAHRFRHTFAINFLRNGGKTLELQRALGHTSLEMVRHYVHLAEVDLEEAHRRASPVANWNL